MSGGGYECTTCRTFHVYSTYLLTRIGRETLIHGCQCGAKHRLTIQGAIQLEQGNTNPSLPRLPSLPIVPNERTFNAALIPPVDEPPVELPVTEWITEGHPVHVGWYELRFQSSGEQIARWWWDGLRYRMSPLSSIHIEADAPSMWRGVQEPALGQVFKDQTGGEWRVGVTMADSSSAYMVANGNGYCESAQSFYSTYKPAP